MASEYEDVLTNQPVVIDNVGTYERAHLLLLTPGSRAREPSRLGSLAKIIPNASSLHCERISYSMYQRY
jgi:hypothetical protein